MKTIIISSIPHEEQIYPTCGDYHETEDEIHIVVSDMGDEQLEHLVIIHELTEVILMRARGIPLQASTDFDLEVESTGKDVDEPGDLPDCPYGREHNFATAVERMVGAALNIKWADYTKAVDALFP